MDRPADCIRSGAWTLKSSLTAEKEYSWLHFCNADQGCSRCIALVIARGEFFKHPNPQLSKQWQNIVGWWLVLCFFESLLQMCFCQWQYLHEGQRTLGRGGATTTTLSARMVILIAYPDRKIDEYQSRIDVKIHARLWCLKTNTVSY